MGDKNEEEVKTEAPKATIEVHEGFGDDHLGIGKYRRSRDPGPKEADPSRQRRKEDADTI